MVVFFFKEFLPLRDTHRNIHIWNKMVSRVRFKKYRSEVKWRVSESMTPIGHMHILLKA